MQTNLVWTLKQLYLALDQYGKMQMQKMDLSPTQGALLYYLLAHKGKEICEADIHAALGISKSSVSSTLKTLKQKGYLSTQENPQDYRKKQIVLLEKAYSAEKRIHANLLAQQKKLCRQIPKERLQCLQEDLEQMLCNLKEEMEEEI